jgi:ribose 5-phosphate isomerase A
MTQEALKHRVAQAAVDYLLTQLPCSVVIGIGTGSTANCFIDALAERHVFDSDDRGVISSSNASTARLKAYGAKILDLNDIDRLPVYIDGADEIDPHGCMIKGGGGALTREKIIAMAAEVFICIVDLSKRVDTLGTFPLPIEIVPLARTVLMRRLVELGATPTLRRTQTGAPWLTDNGHQIIDVRQMAIDDACALEAEISAWPGVVTVGLFAKRRADLCFFGSTEGVEILDYRMQTV